MASEWYNIRNGFKLQNKPETTAKFLNPILSNLAMIISEISGIWEQSKSISHSIQMRSELDCVK